MTLKEKIMKLQTYKMFVGEDTLYVERDDVLKLLEREPIIKNDKVDCKHTDCNNCVNHKYCDYESNKSEIPTGSTTKNDLEVDTVSRKAVINQIFYSTDNNGDVVLGSALRERIARLPSVTPIRPKGRWIYDKSFANWICSKCGKTPKTMGYVGTGTFMAEHFKYCNHCGVEMEEVEE